MIRRYESGIKLRKLSSVLCDDLEGWDWGENGREVPRRGDICIHVADSLCCAAETNRILQNNYTLINTQQEIQEMSA